MPKDLPTLVSNDAGNFGEKMKIVLPDGTEIELYIPHALVPLNETDWEMESQRAQFGSHRPGPDSAWVAIPTKTKNANGKVEFDWNSAKYWLVGRDAEADSRKIHLLGSKKYVYHYLLAYVLGALLQQFPDGHDNLYLAIGHPPSEIAHAPELVRLLSGLHKCMTPKGKEIVFNIRIVTPFDEARGGAIWMTSRVDEDGNRAIDYNSAGLQPKRNFLIFDVGGRIGGIVVATLGADRAPTILTNTHKAVHAGMIDAYDALSKNLRALHKDVFRGSLQIPDEQLSQAFQYRQISLYDGSQKINVGDAVDRSLGVVEMFQTVYETHFVGSNYNAIILTGGGVRDLITPLRERIGHPNMVAVDALDKIVFANAKGGMMILAASLYREGKLPEDYEAVFHFKDAEKKPTKRGRVPFLSK